MRERLAANARWSGMLSALLFVLGRGAEAQNPPSGSLGIERFGIEDGLPGLAIQDLEITDDGLLWVTSSGRLASFDGLVFEEHLTGDGFTWGGGRIVAIGAGVGDTLWVTAGERLFSYAGDRAHLRAEDDVVLRDVWQDADGQVWAWDDRGAVRLGDSGFQRVVTLATRWMWGEVAERPADPTAVEEGTALLDRGRGALRRIDARALLEPIRFPEEWPLPFEGMIRERRTAEGVELSGPGGEWTRSLPAPPKPGPLLLDRRGLLWIAHPGGVEALGATGKVLASLPLAPGALVNAVREDGEGNVWLGTTSSGLYRIRPLPVQVLGTARGLTDGQVFKVSRGGDDAVLALDDQGRVMRVSAAGIDTVFESSPERGSATAALMDRRGTLWVGVNRASRVSLWRRRAGGWQMTVPLSSAAHRIVEDPVVDGVFWVSGWNLYRVRPDAPGGPVVQGPLLRDGWVVRDMVADGQDAVWVAGPPGVARVSGSEVREFLATDGLPTADARALHLDADGTLWIGRYGGGIVRYRNGSFDVVDEADGLWDDIASSLLEDDDGNLWMGSNSGIHRVGTSELNAFLDGGVARVWGRGYGASDGFRNPEASGWPAYRTPDGRLWFPTFSGLAVIDPDTVLARERIAPRVRLRGVRAGGEDLRSDSSVIDLPLGRRRLEVSFGAIALSGQGGMRYEVRLESVDDDWVDVGGQRQVTYGNVPPGRHPLRVRAINGAGVPSSNEAAVTVVIPPYFRETWGFYLLLSMVAAAALVAVVQIRLQRHRAREERLRRLVEKRTEDLARSQEETESALAIVEAQAAQLRSLDEAKSRFFANVSHELRTPLTLVLGPLQDVLDGRLGPTPRAVKEQVEVVLSSGQRLGELVEQLLDIARLEAGELRLDVREHDVRPLLERLASSFEALARSRGVVFEASLPGGEVRASLDADRMEKVWANLLSNALKFTPEGGHVALVVEVVGDEDAGELVVSVEDDGPGIPAEALERIFERFRQADDSARRPHGGAGLGLSIVKEITELHGGRVEIHSEVGRGTRLTVRVPLAGSSTEEPAIPRPAGAPSVIRSAVGEPPLDDDQEEDEDALRPTVLVVEDHDELRAYLRGHLEDRYRVIEARDGREGLAEARRVVPDLVLCDIMMPGMDGEELCRAIRGDPEIDFLPVVMVTARASRPSRLSSLEGGADDYIVKPFDPEELKLRIHNLLASRRRLRERYREEGKALPFLELEPPPTEEGAEFAEQLTHSLLDRLGDEDLDAEGIARTLAMSRATLYRKTKEALDVTPLKLLWKLRLRQAAHWLRETDATVSEVAYACGFKTVPHFTRRFKERFDTTPAAYRRERTREAS